MVHETFEKPFFVARSQEERMKGRGERNDDNKRSTTLAKGKTACWCVGAECRVSTSPSSALAAACDGDCEAHKKHSSSRW